MKLQDAHSPWQPSPLYPIHFTPPKPYPTFRLYLASTYCSLPQSSRTETSPLDSTVPVYQSLLPPLLTTSLLPSVLSFPLHPYLFLILRFSVPSLISQVSLAVVNLLLLGRNLNRDNSWFSGHSHVI